MSLALQNLVSKCQTCNWTGDSWEIICKVDKSHKTENLWAYLNTETKKYEFYHTNLLV